MVEGTDEPTTTERRQKRASAPTDQIGLHHLAYHQHDRAGSMDIARPGSGVARADFV